MFKTVKSKFIFFSLAFIVASVIISSFLLINQFKKNYEQRSLTMLETTLDVLDTGFHTAMLLGKPKNLQNILDRVSEISSINHIRIIDDNGTILHSSIINETGKKIEKISPGHLDISSLSKRQLKIKETHNVYTSSEPILNEPECQSCHKGKVIAYLDVDTNLASIDEAFYSGILLVVFIGGMVVLLLTAGFYKVFDNYFNKPLGSFNKAMVEVESGNLDARLHAKKHDEFGKLEKHFNSMVANLKTSRDKIEELHFEQIQRADKLITMGELTAQVAHEINNHSAIILSRADYLQMESLSTPELRRFTEDFDVIVNQIEKVSSITGNILRHSKKVDKKYLEFNVTKVIDESLKMFEPILKKQNVQLIKDYKVDEAYVFGDPIQIEQAFMNLINNALDSMNNSSKKIEIKLFKDESNFLNLSVSDNGTGILRKDIEQIFSPFFTTKSQGKGTGVGLYIVKTICKNHNAEIFCDSEQNKGSTFTIKFKED